MNISSDEISAESFQGLARLPQTGQNVSPPCRLVPAPLFGVVMVEKAWILDSLHFQLGA